jgi:hypothetical protein
MLDSIFLYPVLSSKSSEFKGNIEGNIALMNLISGKFKKINHPIGMMPKILNNFRPKFWGFSKVSECYH